MLKKRTTRRKLDIRMRINRNLFCWKWASEARHLE
jgi:hypothetical protein